MVVKTITIKVKVLELNEKAKSRAQQRFFGMVRAAQKGEGAASPEVAKVAGEISKKDAKDFAKTKHKGLPEKKEVKEEPERTSAYKAMQASLHPRGSTVDAKQGETATAHRVGGWRNPKNRGKKRKVMAEFEPELEMVEAVGESYVIEKEDSPYEKASSGALKGKTRNTEAKEKEHKTSFRRKAHRNSAAMIIKAKRNAERSGKKLSDDSAADLAHKGWAS